MEEILQTKVINVSNHFEKTVTLHIYRVGRSTPVGWQKRVLNRPKLKSCNTLIFTRQ
jgi:hypothetical protein